MLPELLVRLFQGAGVGPLLRKEIIPRDINIEGSAATAQKADSAKTADKLTKARVISLTGAVTGQASFDGSKDIIIPTTMDGSGGGGPGTLMPITATGNWTVPQTGTYFFVLFGGGGGAGYVPPNTQVGGGSGAVVYGFSYLTAGTVLAVNIGQGGAGSLVSGTPGGDGGPTRLHGLGFWGSLEARGGQGSGSGKTGEGGSGGRGILLASADGTASAGGKTNMYLTWGDGGVPTLSAGAARNGQPGGILIFC